MKHVAGFANSAGTRITAVALARLQSRRSGVVATEQIRTRAVNMDSLHSGSDTAGARAFVADKAAAVCDPGHNSLRFRAVRSKRRAIRRAYEPGGQARSRAMTVQILARANSRVG